MIKDGRAGMELIQIMIVFGLGKSSGDCDSSKDLNRFHDDVCAPLLRITLQHSTAQHSTAQYCMSSIGRGTGTDTNETLYDTRTIFQIMDSMYFASWFSTLPE